MIDALTPVHHRFYSRIPRKGTFGYPIPSRGSNPFIFLFRRL